MEQAFKEQLRQVLTHGTLLENEPMSRHTTFGIGGPADIFVDVASADEICRVCRLARSGEVPFFIVGNGSNLLVSDEGIRGVVIHLGKSFSKVEREGDIIGAQAGASLGKIARTALEASLTGFEFAAGIPGSFGGAVSMNAGAYGGEMKDILLDVDLLTPRGEVLTLKAEEMDLSYRHSIVFDKDYIVLGARIRLQAGDPEKIRERMDELACARREKQPLEYPSAGSTFKRPEGYFAGKLIQDAGLKGYTVGGAMVSEKHAGFVINHGGATAEEVRFLIRQVQKKILEQFGVTMETEVRFLGFENEVKP
ncbi:MAG: UDP-N-acetylmuramate dehydrogenase [Eubacterium sp.]|nr:UDP-N-acetylmuramate dehydrogenase [Eubacterium sp.]